MGSHSSPGKYNHGLGLHNPHGQARTVALPSAEVRPPELTGQGMLDFRPLPIPGCWGSLMSQKPRSSQVSLQELLFQSLSSQLSWWKCPFCPSAPRRVGMWLALGKGPRGARSPGWRTGTFFRDSELPVVHLQLFQVCYQAKDPTVILRLPAFKSGDGGDRSE